MSIIPIKFSDISDNGINSWDQISGTGWNDPAYPGANNWIGQGELVEFAYVGVNLQTDEAGTLTFEFSQNGVNWSKYPVSEFTITSGVNEVHTAWKGGRYVRPRFTGTGGRTYFRIQTYYSNHPLPLTLPLNQTINSDQDATVVRSVSIGEDPNGSFVNQKVDGVAFKTETPLGATGTYTSPLTPTTGYSQIETNLYADTAGTLVGRWYNDENKTNLIRTFTRPYSGDEIGNISYFSSPIFGPYLEYQYTNTSGTQSKFFLELDLRTKSISGQIIGLKDFIPNTVVANLGRNVIVGETDGGQFLNVPVTENGNLKVAIENPKTAFNEISVANPTPVAQISFEYGINNQLMITSVTGAGSVGVTSSLLLLQTGSSSSSSAQLISRRYLKYRPGQGAVARGTMLFTTGVENSKQYAGVGNSTLTDGFFFGYNGTSFGIFHISYGSENFITQSSWNVDVMDGSSSISNPSGQNLVHTNGNVFQIKYQYLGFGCIFFYIEHAEDGEFSLVHVIQYPNTNTLTNLANPSLNLVWRVVNTTNTTNISLRSGSGALFTEGFINLLGPKNGIDNNKSGITTLTNILTLRNATTYNTVTNRGQIRVRGVSIAYDGGNGIATLQIILNTTLGGSPSYTTINGTSVDGGITITNGQSIVSYDVAGTTITGGTILFNSTVSRNSSQYVDLSNLDMFISPGDILTFAMKATTSGVCSVAVNWIEDI